MATKAVLSEAEVGVLVKDIYGLNVTELKSLPSYDDINYRLKTDEGLFLLKIFHGEMSANRVRLEEQLNFQYFLKNKGLLVPGIRKTQSGDLQVYREMAVTNGSKMECAIRMLEYVEGDICQKLPLCDEFFYEIGVNCGRMHALMEKNSSDFPGLNSLRHHWTLESVVDEVWAKQIPAIDSDATRAIVENVVNEFRNYLSTSKNLPSGVVHCDLNSLNIIGEKKDDKNVEFKAIIDFGDVCGSAFMFDLAICLIYMMVAAKVQNGDYYNIATQVYLGYISARSLSETERKGLLLAVKARAAQSVIGGYYTASIEPENREYLMSECSVAEKLLHEIVDEKFNGMMVHDL